MTTPDAAREYLSRGWQPIPVPHRSKKPALKGWPDLRLTAADLARHFNGQPPSVPRARCPECLARRGCGPARAIVTPDAPPAIAYQAVRMWGGTGHFNWAPWEQEADYAVPLKGSVRMDWTVTTPPWEE